MRSVLLSRPRKRRSSFLSLPVILAFCLFVISLAGYAVYSADSSAQAGRIVKKLFSSEYSGEMEEAARIGLPLMYKTYFSGELTEAGIESLILPGIPYTLYWQQYDAPITRIYAQKPELIPEKDGVDSDTVRYQYTVETEFHLQRRLEKAAPVVRKTYTGTITLRRTGWLKWKMDAITIDPS